MSGLAIASAVIAGVAACASIATGIYSADAQAKAADAAEENADKQETQSAQMALKSEIEAKRNKAEMLAKSADGIVSNNKKIKQLKNSSTKSLAKADTATDPLKPKPSCGNAAGGATGYFTGKTASS